MSEFKGKAGTIFIEKDNHGNDKPWEVWFENLAIIGTGNSEREALEDAVRHVENIGALVSEALVKVIGDEPSGTAASGGEVEDG